MSLDINNPHAEGEMHPFPVAKRTQLDAMVQSRQPYNPPNSPSNPENIARQKQRREAMADIQDSASAQTQMPTMPRASSATIPEPTLNPELIGIKDPGFTKATSEAIATSLELPSRFAYYEFKDLYVTPFVGKHLGKLSRAHAESSLLHVVEAVSSVLSSTSGIKDLAFKLTLPDFYFVLYWLRTNSFTKSVYRHTTECTNRNHIQLVVDLKAPPESLTISEIINKTSLSVNMLDAIPNPDDYKLDNPNIIVRPATMQDTLEITMSPNITDTEWLYYAELACYVDILNTEQPLSVEQRIEYIKELSGDDIFIIKDFSKKISNYGVVEKIKVRCKYPECGASRDSVLSLDAHSFLSAA